MENIAQVIRYHQETKHHFFRYARSHGYLDWANQPNPFRHYAGAPLLQLPILSPDADPVSPSYQDLYKASEILPVPVSIPSISRFFEYALSITAWKQAGGTRWALRSNPSSGNLHPTEGYLITPPVSAGGGNLSIAAGLYHYAPKEHALEQRVEYSSELLGALMNAFPPNAFLVGLSSIHWREAWKYGERAFRYCQHDAGHAIGTLRIAASALGWHLELLEGLSHETIEWLLGLNRDADFDGAEREEAEVLAVVCPAPMPGEHKLSLFLEPSAVYQLVRESLGRWEGKANRLSPEEPVSWKIIDEVTAATRKHTQEQRFVDWQSSYTSSGAKLDGKHRPESLSAVQIVHQRRSALAFDGKTGLSAETFFTMLQRVTPRIDLDVAARPMPWDSFPWDPSIHLALFVHRVEGLAPGLYMLARDPSKVPALKAATHPHFAWTKPAICPADLHLYLLEDGNAQRLAAQISCHQDIAADGAFSLGMIAEFEPTLRQHGAWFYRRLFWETGLIGQVLYLEAEAAGVRATGIGCFFDDPMHDVLGVKDLQLQSLYHFTAGGPVEDTRLTTLPAYGEVRDEKQDGMDLP